MSEVELRAAVDNEIQALCDFFASYDDNVETKTAVLLLERIHGLNTKEIQLLAQGKGRLEVVEE